MKKENRSGQLRRSGMILFILVATFIFVATSWGKTINSGTPGVIASTSQPAAPNTTRDSVFVYVDEMPIFPGGDTALLKYIGEKAIYPESAKKNHIMGKVVVKFIVEKNCTVSDVTILQSVDPQLDAEAIRVIKTLPKFEKPAKSGGRPVAVWYMLPISFSMK